MNVLFHFMFAVRKACRQNPDGLFQSRTVSFWGRNVGKIVMKFCDTEMKIKVGRNIFCKRGNNGLTIFNDAHTGRTEEVQKLEIFVLTIIIFCKTINTGFFYV